MGDQGNYGSSGLLRWYVQSLSELIETDNFVENEKLLAERAIEQMRSAEFIRDKAMEKIKQIDPVSAEEIEQCMRLILHGAYACGAFVPTLKTSGRRTLRKNTSSARKAAEVKRSRRDQVLENELGGLISKGLRGEKLRKALLKIFADQKVEPAKAEPGPRIVSTWVRQYRDLGMWRAPQQS